MNEPTVIDQAITAVQHAHTLIESAINQRDIALQQVRDAIAISDRYQQHVAEIIEIGNQLRHAVDTTNDPALRTLTHIWDSLVRP